MVECGLEYNNINKILLKGVIRNIKYSHTINEIEYNQAEVVTITPYGEDIVPIKFKKFANPYKDGDKVFIEGNLRSRTTLDASGSSNVELYVFTEFKNYELLLDIDSFLSYNTFNLYATVCSMQQLRHTKSGKTNLHLVVANNLNTGTSKLSNYLPSVIWGKLAIDCSKNLNVGDKIFCEGHFHSRLYLKKNENNENEYRVAHELVIDKILNK